MLILRLFCENSPRIIAASGADPTVLKTGIQALVCQFLKHSNAIFPYKNNNHIFYDYSEINQKGLPVRKT
jgi:hypothetical protein